MYILAVETTGKYGSAAVINEKGTAVSVSSENEMNHLQDIISISDASIKAAGIGKDELTHVAASVGPGSFTGIRIGVTTARTLGQMLGLACIGVSSLEGLADRALSEAVFNECDYILAIINARRHQTYAGLWKIDGDERKNDSVAQNNCRESAKMHEICEQKQYMIEEMLENVAKELSSCDKSADNGENSSEKCAKVLITGDGVDAYREIIEEKLDSKQFILASEQNRYQNAENIANIALKMAENDEIMSFEELKPNYMRLSEAEQRLKEGTLSEKIKNLK